MHVAVQCIWCNFHLRAPVASSLATPFPRIDCQNNLPCEGSCEVAKGSHAQSPALRKEPSATKKNGFVPIVEACSYRRERWQEGIAFGAKAPPFCRCGGGNSCLSIPRWRGSFPRRAPRDLDPTSISQGGFIEITWIRYRWPTEGMGGWSTSSPYQTSPNQDRRSSPFAKRFAPASSHSLERTA